jgi:hypothetical protein
MCCMCLTCCNGPWLDFTDSYLHILYTVTMGIQKDALKHMDHMWGPYTRSVDCSYDMYCIRGRKKWWANRAAAQGPNLWGTLRHHWNNRNYDAGNIMFPRAKGFLRKLSTFWSRTFKTLRQSCQRTKRFKVYLFEWAAKRPGQIPVLHEGKR